MLFLDRIYLQQANHDAGDDGWEEGEEQPYHLIHGNGVGDSDDGLACVIGERHETRKAQQQGYQRTADGSPSR